ncbi:MAG: hypothetical protein OXD40_01145 [bacterium]|nr:hypothetical protein [bacterium]
MVNAAAPGIDPGDSLEEIVAAIRWQTVGCPVVDGLSPTIAPSTRAE